MPIATEATAALIRGAVELIRDRLAAALTTRNDSLLVTGSITAANGTVDGVTDVSAYASVRIQVGGTFSATWIPEASLDGVTWKPVAILWPDVPAYSSLGGIVNGTGSMGSAPVPGRFFRVRVSAFTSGSVAVSLLYSTAPYSQALPSVTLGGSVANIGRVAGHSIVASGTLAALNAVADGVTDLSAMASVRVQVTGTAVAQFQFQSSVDGTNWTPQYLSTGTGDSWYFGAPNGALNARYYGDVGGRYFRVLMSAYTSGSLAVSIVYSSAASAVGNRQVAIQDTSGNGANFAGGTLRVQATAGTADVGNVANKAAVVSGSIAAAAAVVDGTTDLVNLSTVRLQVSGTWVATLQFETSVDGATWTPTTLIASSVPSANVSPTTGATGNAVYVGLIRGRYFRVRASSWTSGTATVSLLYTAAPEPSVVHLGNSAANIGTVGIAGGTTQGVTTSGSATGWAQWKGGAGVVHGFQAWNPTAAVVYVKLYNKASVPVPATDVPVYVLAVPPKGNAEWRPLAAQYMGTGIQVTVTGGEADTDTTIPGAGVKVIGQNG